MRKIICIALLLLTVSGAAQAQRGLTASKRVEDYRPLGDIRLWTFVHRDSVLGTLVSAVAGRTEIDDISGLIIKEELKLDFRKILSPLNMHIVSEHYVSDDGYYLGDEMKLTINENTEQLVLKREGPELEGYMTRGGNEFDQKLSFPRSGFAAESNFLDQYELFWAMRDFKVGDTIVDTVFMPQSMVSMPVRAVVEKYEYLQVYNKVYDSAFVIHYWEPQEQYHYFTPGKRLIKAWIPSQNIRAFLDAVRQTTPSQQQQQASTANRSLSEILSAYSIYLVVAVIAAAFFIGSGYRWPVSYLGLAAGAVGFGMAAVTQLPLQTNLFKNVFIPHVNQGDSPLIWGILPAVAAGVIQELLKVIAIWAVIRWRQVRSHQSVALGAMVGAGFAVVEAGYLAWGTGTNLLLGIGLLERLFVILFHVTSGAILADSLARGYRWLAIWAGITMGVNTAFRYLPLFVQSRLASPEMLAIFLASVSVIFLAVVLLIFKKSRQEG